MAEIIEIVELPKCLHATTFVIISRVSVECKYYIVKNLLFLLFFCRKTLKNFDVQKRYKVKMSDPLRI